MTTPAQRLALEAVDAGLCWMRKGTLTWHKPSHIKRSVMNRLLEDELICCAIPAKAAGVEWLNIRLTPWGREALQRGTA